MADPPGFYGKLPSRGDFLARRIPSALLPLWDGWLAGLVAAARATLGADWLAAWNEAPVWHFALGPGLAGPGAWAGVLIPSIDRVGRQFPFSILGAGDPAGQSLADWRLAIEALAIAALEDDFDPARLEHDLAALGPPAPDGDVAPGGSRWECRGTARVAACVLRCAGLPDAAQSAAMVAGSATPPP